MDAGGGDDRATSPRLLASRHPGADEMDAYERVLGDAMAGDATLFAREDYVEEAWRIVDPVLKAGHAGPRVRTEPGTWGPTEVRPTAVLRRRGWAWRCHRPGVVAE